MKKTILLILILFALPACTSLKMKTSGGTEVEYSRKFSGLKISSMTIAPGDDGKLTVSVEGVESDITEAMQTINNVLDKIK